MSDKQIGRELADMEFKIAQAQAAGIDPDAAREVLLDELSAEVREQTMMSADEIEHMGPGAAYRIVADAIPEEKRGEKEDQALRVLYGLVESALDVSDYAGVALAGSDGETRTCEVCGGELELSEQHPQAGLLHKNDADDADGHTPRVAAL